MIAKNMSKILNNGEYHETIVTRVGLKDVQVLRYKKAIADIQIVGVGNGMVGCDGTDYFLTVQNGFVKIELKWWCEIPPYWVGVDKIVELLEGKD